MSPAAGQYALPVFPSTRRPPVGFVLFAKSGKQLLQRIAAALPWPLDNFDDECAVLDRHFRALALGRTDLFGKCARHSQRKAVAPSHKFSSHHPLRRGAKYLQRISVRYADGNENQYPVARIQRQARAKRPGCGRGGSAGGRGGFGYGGGVRLGARLPAPLTALDGSWGGGPR